MAWPIVAMAAMGAAGSYMNSKEAKKDRTSTSTSQLMPYQGTGDYLDFIVDQAGINFLNPAEQYGGNIPTWSGGEGYGSALQGLQQMMNSGWSPKQYKESDLWHTGKDWITSVLEGDAAENPYLQEMIGNLRTGAKEDYLETIAPQVSSQFNIAGRTGSGMAEMGMADAKNKWGENLMAAETGMMGQAFSDYLNTQTQAAGIGGQYEGLLVNAYQAFNQAKAQSEAGKLQAALGLGNLSMAGGNAGYQSELQKYMIEKGMWDANQNLPNTQLSQLASYIMPIAQTFGKQEMTSTQPGANVNPWGAALSGAAGGAATGYGMSSGGGMGGKGGGGGASMMPQGQGWGMYQNPQYPNYFGPYQ